MGIDGCIDCAWWLIQFLFWLGAEEVPLWDRICGKADWEVSVLFCMTFWWLSACVKGCVEGSCASELLREGVRLKACIKWECICWIINQ